MKNSSWEEIYKEIGATPVINAIGSVTMLGGSITIPEVNEAMERANSTYIPMAELQEKVGRLLSEIIDTEFSKLSLSNDRNSFIFFNSLLISFTSDSGKSKKLLSLYCHVPFFLIPRFSKDL